MNTAMNDNELEKVVGGTSAGTTGKVGITTKKQEFEAAWNALKLEQQYTGMKRAELYDEWEAAGFKPDATTFLLSLK